MKENNKIAGSVKAIAFDADDTLWALQNYFEDVEDEYCDLLSDYGSKEEISASLFETESGNMEDLGYGVKAFTISLVENAVKVSQGEVPAKLIGRIVELGKTLLRLDARPLEGVEETLARLRQTRHYKLAVFTKGELQDQENKLWRSGLQRYFDVVSIVSDKTPEAYRRLCRELEVKPEELVMVGNSFKSDIVPALKIGASAVHIPFHTTWAHEKRRSSLTNASVVFPVSRKSWISCKKFLVSVNHGAIGLMGGENQHLGYLNMLGSAGGIECHVGNIIASQWLNATVNIVGTLGVAMETDVGEIGLHQSRLDVGNANAGMSHVDAQTIGDGFYCTLGGTVHISARIGSIASHTSDVDDMTTIAFHHAGNNEPGHGEQTLNVGIYHLVPVVEVAFVLWFQASCQSCIIDQDIDVAPCLRNIVNCLASRFSVAHVESQCQHLDTFLFKFLFQNFQFACVAACDDEVVASLCESSGASFANTACGACDKSYFLAMIIMFWINVLTTISRFSLRHCPFSQSRSSAGGSKHSAGLC